MSDERDESQKDEEAPSGDDSEDKGGLGLTEEFARIESEIEREIHGRGAGDDDAESDGDERGDSEPRDVRWDDDDSAEWPAPVPVEAGRRSETDEWGAVDEDEVDDEATEDASDGVHSDEVSDEPVPPVPTEPEPVAHEPAEPVAEAPEPAAEEPAEPADDEAVEEPRDEEPEADDEPDEPEPSAAPGPEAPATEHTIVRPRPLAPRPPAAVAMGAGGGAPLDDVEFAKTPALWWRFVTASVVIVAATATAISVNILLFLGEVAADLKPIKGVDRVIDSIDPGEPQTILILGSDKRSNTPGDPGRSDTTMLLRVDAENDVLSLFSLPRDLKVDIPEYGVGKLNEAYTYGGVKSTVATVKELLGININHVVNVDFQGFADAVSAIDCVYVDVDRDYFNDNSGLFGDQTFAVIDVNAGYQRLCGQNALDYVRYRHTDTDIVRAARQQDFLSQARQQVPAGEVLPILGGDLGSDLLDIFTEYTSSDISTTEDVLSTLKAFIAVRNVPIKRVSFDGTLEESFVTATPEQIEKAVDEFLGGEDSSGPAGKVKRKNSGGGDKKDEAKKKKEPDTDGSSLISTEDASINCLEGQDKFAAFGRTSARRLKFPVYVPTAVEPGSCYDDGSRQYAITDPDDDKNSAYKMVIRYETSSTLPEYYGIMGTTWADPPILEDPSDTIEIGDRSFDIYYDGDRLQRVAWHDDENNAYWLSNTLLGTLEEADMLEIAKSTVEADG